MDKCPFCGAKDSELGFAEDAYDCGTTVLGNDIDRKPECYENEITTLRALVNELLWLVKQTEHCGWRYKSVPAFQKAKEILSRPLVREITEEKP